MRYRRFLHTLSFCLAVAFMGKACAVELTETVECELADGSAFILRAQHDWAFPNELTRRRANRADQQDFKVYYRARGTGNLAYTGANLAYLNLQQRPNLEVLCSRLGLHQGQPGTGLSLRMPDEKRFWVPARTGKSDLDKQEQRRIDALITQRGLRVMGKNSALAIRQGKLVQELPLTAADLPACAETDVQQCPVSAVLRMTSSDRGDTWQPASIETAPYFFETGIALARQAGIAHPSVRSLRNYRNHDDQPCQTKCTE